MGTVTVSGHGLMVLWNVAIKSTISVLAVILLSSTTPFPELLRGMEKMRIPHMFTTLLSFMYRYIFVLIDEMQRMRRARDSRGWKGKWIWQAKVIGHMIASLFIRSYERGERVYAAMLARGYGGEVQTLYLHQFGVMEMGFLALMILTPLAARIII